MGEIADTMRSALRELAQADARLYLGLAEELGDGATAVEEPRALIQPEGGVPATEAELLALKGPELQELCAQRGLKVAKRARKDVMVGLLLADSNGPPPLSLLPPPQAQTSLRWEGHGSYGRQSRHRRAPGPGAAPRSLGATGAADRSAGGRGPGRDHAVAAAGCSANLKLLCAGAS